MKRGERRHDVDWLRTLASYLVLIYHVAQFFDFQEKAYVKNAQLSQGLDTLTQFVYLWHMPLFFLLAGWSSKPSLSRRGPWRFLGERAKRLLIPLVFGLVALCAPPRWVELKHGLFRSTTTGERLPAMPGISFTDFLSEYYYSAGGISWNHLWFLVYLFTFTLLYLPGFWVLSKLEWVEKWTHGWSGWVLGNSPVVALVLVQVNLRERWPGYQNLTDDWANFWFYSIFFITGFCLAQYPALEAQLHANWIVNFVIGSVSCFTCLLPSLSNGFFQLSAFAKYICSALGAWYMVLVLLSLALLNFKDDPPSAFWAEHAFPVYVVHDAILSVLADGIVGSWGAPIFFKYFVLSWGSLFLSLLVMPRHNPFLCALVGMKPAARSASSGEKVSRN